MKSLSLENSEVILMNGKIYAAVETKDGFILECLDNILGQKLKDKIISNELTGEKTGLNFINRKYGKEMGKA